MISGGYTEHKYLYHWDSIPRNGKEKQVSEILAISQRYCILYLVACVSVSDMPHRVLPRASLISASSSIYVQAIG